MITVAGVCAATYLTLYTAINTARWLSRNWKDWIYTIFPENTDGMILAAMMMHGESPAAPQSSGIVSIPGSIYRRDGSDMNTNCVICLGQLQEGEMVVQLPFCLHLFHEKCINLWFRRNSTCPSCRLQLSADTTAEKS